MLGQMGETTKLDLAEFTGHACRVVFVGALANRTAAVVTWLHECRVDNDRRCPLELMPIPVFVFVFVGENNLKCLNFSLDGINLLFTARGCDC